MKMSQNKRNIIVTYSDEMTDLIACVKRFEIQSNGNYKMTEFLHYNDVKQFKNFFFDSSGVVKKLKIYVIKKTSSKSIQENFYVENLDEALELRLPSSIFINGLLDPDNNFERFIQSEDLRLIICGRIIV